MTTNTQPGYDRWIGADAYDNDGDKIGRIEAIYYDDVTRRPEWLAVKAGLTKASINFVPIAGAQIRKDADHPEACDLQVCYGKGTVKDAPEVDVDLKSDDSWDQHLSAADERRLYKHYGFDYDEQSGTGTYGTGYGKLRPDVDYTFARWDRESRRWTTEDTGAILPPPDRRLRRYRTTDA